MLLKAETPTTLTIEEDNSITIITFDKENLEAVYESVLEELLKEHDDYYRKVVNGECAPDELHCTCVPALRDKLKQLEAQVASVKKYYIHFTCSGCDVEYGIEVTDDVEMELIGVSRFACKQCGIQTEWTPHNISKLQMPFLYEKYDA